MTPMVRKDWPIHVQGKKEWSEIFNSNNIEFWGTGDVYNPTIPFEITDEESEWYKLSVQLPALSAIVLK
jgi:1,4-alpha-glucan branching enzyme